MNIPCGRKPLRCKLIKTKILKGKGRERKEEGKVRRVVGGWKGRHGGAQSVERGSLGMCAVQPVLLALCPEFQKGAHCQAGPGREGEAGRCSAGPGI